MKFLHTALLVTVLCSVSFADAPWSFIITADSRGSDDGINRTILGELATEIMGHSVDFVLFPGDLVSGYAAADPAEFECQLRVWVEVMKPVYDANIPVYVGRGNHELGDVYSSYPYPGPEPDPNDNDALRWLNVFGSDSYPDQKLPGNGPEGEQYMTYYVIHKNAFIACLDQYAGVRHTFLHKVNQDWLDAQLAANTKPHIFVAGHEPAFRTLHTDCLDNHPDSRDAFWTSIGSAGARTYLCGHDHFYDHARIDDGDGDPNNDIHQYIVGSAGAPLYTWSPPYAGNKTDYSVEQWHHSRRYGYVLVEVDGLEVTLTWMERNSNDVSITGVYEPNDVWSYEVTPKPIVLSPNGGEKLVAGSAHTITWKTLDGADTEHVIIEYSPDNGRLWLPVGDILLNTGSYEWTIPAIDSNRCLLRVLDLREPSLSDASDVVFTIFRCRQRPHGDLNGDCYVDMLDFAMLADSWLKSTDGFEPSSDGVFAIFRCPQTLQGDLNSDCYVDVSDFALFAHAWLEHGNPFGVSCGEQE